METLSTEEGRQNVTTCIRCGATREKPAPPRLPRGWKRMGSYAYCPDCWRLRYVLRAVTIPVGSPVGCDWSELRSALREMWAATTQASNWMLTELYTRDVRRNGQPKMPPMPRIYLYPETRARFPQLPSQTCAALEQTVQFKYRAVRYKLIWTSEVSLPTYRYPTPFPVPAQGWSVQLESERIIVSARIGDQRLALRLREDLKFARQRKAVEKIISGAAVPGELALYQQGKAIMCKMVAWLPRDENAQRQKYQRTGVLRVRTDPEAMLVALNEKDDRLWIYNGDHIVRWSGRHRTQLQRWAEDSKAEHRPVPPFAERRAASAQNYHRRMSSAAHEIAAMVAGYADRRRFAAVRLDDADHSFCEQFPWFRLRQLIAEKLDAKGITLEIASGEAAPEPAQSLDAESVD